LSGGSGFQRAVESTQNLESAYRSGKQALNTAAKTAVDHTGVALTGSIDLDDALATTHPNDPRWDYGIAHVVDENSREFVTWIELHPATPGETKSVVGKHDWLRSWLEADGRALRQFPCCSVWIATKGIGIPKNSPERRRLALKGILGPCKHFRLRGSESS